MPLLVLMAAERLGIGRAELLRVVDLDFDSLLEEDARVPLHVERTLWREAAARTKDPLFGLHVTEQAPPGSLGLYELLLGSSSSLQEAIEIAGRYLPLLYSGGSFRFDDDGASTTLVVSFGDSEADDDDEVAAQAADYFAATSFMVAASCTGGAVPIRKVSLPRRPPERRSQVEEMMGRMGTSKLDFGTSKLAITFESAMLSRRFLGAAPKLNRLLRSHADSLLGGLREHSGFLLRARQHLLGELPTGRATLPGLAARLGMDRRSLQRRLAAHGSSFSELLDAVRRDLAPRYLQDEEMGLAEVAFRLGYSSPQAFHRAFHGWTGMSPGRFRRERGSSSE